MKFYRVASSEAAESFQLIRIGGVRSLVNQRKWVKIAFGLPNCREKSSEDQSKHSQTLQTTRDITGKLPDSKYCAQRHAQVKKIEKNSSKKVKNQKIDQKGPKGAKRGQQVEKKVEWSPPEPTQLFGSCNARKKPRKTHGSVSPGIR
jgi:hypothetical protein